MPTSANDTALVISCEHATCRVPRQFAELFDGAKSTLESHRGWDPGALEIAREIARVLDAPCIASKFSRLLVEPNRSLHHPRLWSEFTRALPQPQREKIVRRYYQRHRQQVVQAIRDALRQHPVVAHIGVHTFTPELNGVVRNADIGLLYDPSSAGEKRFAECWRQELRRLRPDCAVRMNYPYRGTSDGLTTSLRRIFPPTVYWGLELEVNQRRLADNWDQLATAIAHSVKATFAPQPKLV